MARTVLQIIQDATPRLGISSPSAVFSATTQTELELQRVIKDAADTILRKHDWSVLKVLQTHVGDGTTTSFALPSDYLRMPKDGKIWSTRWQHPLWHITTEDYLNLDVRDYDIVTGAWTLLGGNVVYRPALTTGESAKFYYVSHNVAADSGGTAKERFTADTDTFRLDDRVLELMFIWQWRHKKGFDTPDDLDQANTALGQAITRDKGARVITQRSRSNSRTNVAYPREVTT